MYDTIVIGGGAAGMMAAITAARQGVDVLILEHMDQCGKKILATGNGRCNYTNQMQGIEYYRSDSPAFVLSVLEQFDAEDTLSFFEQIGITPTEKNGYYYPMSMQAVSVRDVLLMELERLGVEIRYNIGIRGISDKNSHYEICTKNGDFLAKTCILATGGKSSKKTGSDGSGFLYLVPLSHHVSDLVPALVGLKAKQPYFKEVAGIRAYARVTLFVENAQKASDLGEVQLTDYGISGIPVFQVSRYATIALENHKKVTASLQFLPDMEAEKVADIIAQRFVYSKEKTAFEALIGLFPQKLARLLLKLAGIPETKKAICCTKEEQQALCGMIGNFPCEITGSGNFEQAQVTAGGVVTEEVCEKTLESKLHKGLYFAGEMLNVDGMCGGYNLQWAWSSGYAAGKAAAEKAAQCKK